MDFKKLLLFATVGFVASQPVAEAGDLLVQPSITVAEEYNDNIYETPSNEVSDFITHLVPGISFKYSAAAWDWEGSYFLDYAYYARLGNDQITHTLMTKGLVKLVDEFAFLEISDTYRRASLDVTRDVTQENYFSNQSDQNIFSVSPYLVFHPTAASTLKTGYRYTNIWYREPSALDKNENSLYAEGTYDLSSSTSLIGSYVFTNQDTRVNTLKKHDVLAGVRHEYLDKCYVYAQAGTSFLSFDPGEDSSNFIWLAGVSHSLDTVVISLESGVRYSEDPTRNMFKETYYTGKVTKAYKRGEGFFTLYYSDYDTPTSSFSVVSSLSQRNKYGASLGFKHEILDNLTGNAAVTGERYEFVSGGRTDRLFLEYGLLYQLPRDFSVALTHKYFRYSSPTVSNDNRDVNRVIAELRKVF